MNAIEIESLSKTYRKGRRPAVRAGAGIDLTVEAGQVFGLLGPNGAGKTTTIKMMCGLVRPSSGTVRLNGYDVARHRSQAMAQIGVVLEGTRNVYWRLSAWQNLIYFGRLKGQRGDAFRSRAEWLLKSFDLWDRRNDEVREFSRGMQQKVAVACALVADAPIILLDEPTLGLDVQAARLVKTWIGQLASENGKTVVLTTHQIDMAQELCQRVAIVSAGRVVADGPIDELLGRFESDSYEVRLEGRLDGYEDAFRDLTITEEGGETVLSGPIPDQAELHRVLARVQELGLPLVSVGRVLPDLEDVFVQMLEEEKD